MAEGGQQAGCMRPIGPMRGCESHARPVGQASRMGRGNAPVRHTDSVGLTWLYLNLPILTAAIPCALFDLWQDLYGLSVLGTLRMVRSRVLPRVDLKARSRASSINKDGITPCPVPALRGSIAGYEGGEGCRVFDLSP